LVPLLASSLKRRCNYFQIFSRVLTLACSRQDLLHEPISARTPDCVKQCGFIGLNALQGASGRVLARGVDCKGAYPDNGHCYEYSRDNTFSDSR